MKRGRKQDDTLPPSRSREIQRAFRQRRSDYIRGLEERVQQLEAEVDEVLTRNGEPVRYSAADILAARAACRKKQKSKSKHNLDQFLNVTPLEGNSSLPSAHRPPENSGAFLNDTMCIDPCRSPATPNHTLEVGFSAATKYALRDLSNVPSPQHSPGRFSRDSYPMVLSAGRPNQFGYPDRPRSTCPTSPKPREAAVFQPWDSQCNTSLVRSSSDSPHPNSYPGQSSALSSPDYGHSSSHLDLFVGIDSGPSAQNPTSQLLSSFESQENTPLESHGSLPAMVSNSSCSSTGSLSNMSYNSYHNSNDIPGNPYQPSERYNSCSYPFMGSSGSSSPKVSTYTQEAAFSVFPDQQQHVTDHQGSFSTLVAIATTRLDSFESRKIAYGYQANSSLNETSHFLNQSPIPQHSALGEKNTSSVGANDLTRPNTPASTSASEPKVNDQYSHPKIGTPPATQPIKPEPLPRHQNDENSACIPLYSTLKHAEEWPRGSVLDFHKPLYSTPVKYSAIDR